ncbi:hypothetical protein tb265_42600 [Gemmatimonadetes bacterium T265]|nr:hypothetical protein tb265_42600 [Gemmatimonadetes bacterium T265]
MGSTLTLGRELGGGGMSRVFVAEDARLGRRVVVKVLAPELAEGMSAARFAREVRLAARLQHPNIVPVLAAEDRDGLAFYTMPYVDGESLRARLAGGGRPDLGQAVTILRDMARALGYAHAQGVVHRDVKPDNVLLSDGAAAVADFGIAKAVSAARTVETPPGAAPTGTLTRAGASLGTPAYMAPEQAAGDPDVDARADLYAWGVVAYELLAGHHPFAGKATAQQLITAHLGETPRALRTVAPAVRAPLAALVMRCLAKDPAQRPATAAELLAVLDAGLATGARAAVPRRARLGAVAALALLGLGGTGVAWRAHAGGAGVSRTTAAVPLMLAVLPFDNAGPAEQAVFTDGLTDAVTAKLGALPGFAVIDRRSAAQYRATAKPARQVGAELGVPYLVEGVVRWTRDGAGAWRAQVTPTVVDARAGTTTWTGAPVVLTAADPFSAQTAVATQVAAALHLALEPAGRAALARPLTHDPEALAAYVRGTALLDAVDRAGWTPDTRAAAERSAAEFAQAVARDSAFGDAWGAFALARFFVANTSPGDTAAMARLRTTLAQARAYVPDNPGVLIKIADTREYIDHDTVGVDALYGRAAAGLPPNNARRLRLATFLLDDHHQYDSAYALLRRAVALDPRSARTLDMAARSAGNLRHWAEARGYADALIALDSTNERGWAQRLVVLEAQGDTLAAQGAAAQALARLPHPSYLVLNEVAYAGGPYGPLYLGRSARDLGITTLYDSVAVYYDTKTDVCLRLGDGARARAYADSLQRLLARRPPRSADDSVYFAPFLAFAQATLGDTAAARATLTRALAQARAAPAADSLRVLDAELVAGTYARLGEPETAVRWLEASVTAPGRGVTAQGYAVRPKLLVLHGTPAFERFRRAHPE